MNWGSELRALYDVSALLALFDEEHRKHDPVFSWFTANAGEGWASCPLAQNGFLRIISQPSYLRPRSLIEAYERLLDATSDINHQFIADDISLLDNTLVRFRDLGGPGQLTDVYLLALAVAHNMRLVTLDKRVLLTPVVGATEDHLVVI